MKEYLFLIYKIIIFLISYIIIIKRDNNNTKNKLGIILFMIYLYLVLTVTSPGVIYDINRYGFTMRNINLKPFSEEISTIGYVLNVFMFIPLGFLLAILWDGYNLKKTVFTGFIFSFIIEFFQLFNFRASDIDDLIMNTLGCLIGYIIYKIFLILFKKIDKLQLLINKFQVQINPIIIFSIYMLVRFFLYDEFLLAKFIYKF